MADEIERVSVNPGGVDEHRPLTTGDLPLIAAYVKDANKSERKPKPKPKSKGDSK